MDKFVRPMMKTRDKLVHWRWGYSPHLPDDLLLMEADAALLSHHAALQGPIEIDETKVFVITNNYLIRLLRDLRELHGCLALLIQSIGREGTVIPPLPTALHRLSTRPQIARHLADRRRKAKTPPAQPGRSPETGYPSEPE